MPRPSAATAPPPLPYDDAGVEIADIDSRLQVGRLVLVSRLVLISK